MNHTDALLKAENYQSKAQKLAQQSYWKPKYHITAPANWINDPNGFCYFNGEYHLFYQYHPYSSKWGPMHWGHAVSKDLANWQNRPIALAPSNEYDKDGCFSGSAIEKDGKLYVLYTGHVDLEKINVADNDRIESQCLAISEDGINFNKFEQNPVIKELPRNLNLSTEHFRDPKIWQHDDIFYAIVGAQTKQKTGQVVVYKSRDLYHWEFFNIMATSNEQENLGFMWECPNFAEINDAEVLILSPQGINPEGNKFLNLHQSGYFLGKMDYISGIFERQSEFDLLDYGFDFYAPQIMQDKINNRCIMIGWLDMWETTMPEQKEHWAGMMSIPRILTIKNNMIYSIPAPELKILRKEHIHYEQEIQEETSFTKVYGDCYELNTCIDFKNAKNFMLKLRVSETEETILTYDKELKIFKLNRNKSGKALSGEREVNIDLIDNKLELQIFSDKSSLEIFLNKGQRVISTRIYPTENAQKIIFSADNVVNLNIDFYKL